jgi:alpha-L-fucosidase
VAGIWFDGWWDQQSKRFEDSKDAAVTDTRIDWRLEQTYDLIHRLQPAALVGANHHVAPFAGEDFQMFERDLPGQNKGGHSRDAVIGDLPLETCDTINGAWGYSAGDTSHKSVEQLVKYLVRSAGMNANLLLNVGPKPDGTIDDVSAERLRGMGEWLRQYGETIYGTRGGPVAAQEWGVTTKKPGVVYVHVLKAPEADADGWTNLSGAGKLAEHSLKVFGTDVEVASRVGAGDDLFIRLPEADEAMIDMVLVAEGD